MSTSATKLLTRAQRLMRPLVSLIMRRVFPNCAFLGGKLHIFGRRMDEADSVTTSAALLLVRAASESKKEKRIIRINGYSRELVPDGNWLVTVERAPKPKDADATSLEITKTEPAEG